jgi:hypothetical protein
MFRLRLEKGLYNDRPNANIYQLISAILPGCHIEESHPQRDDEKSW